jgi:hypothetical protein
MTRKLKAGAALVIVFAIGAVAVSAASARYVLTPGANPAILTGWQIGKGSEGNSFEITSRGTKVACEKASYVGTTEGTEVSEVRVHPKYEECLAFGLAATIDTVGCDYLLTGETDAFGHGKIHVICNTGAVVKITIPSISCTLKIHEQTPTETEGDITYINVGGGSDIQAEASVRGITYERVGNGVLCAAGAPSEGNDGFLTAKLTINAYEDLGCTGNLTLETFSCAEGFQVYLSVD